MVLVPGVIMIPFALRILLPALLLFQLQPMIGKFILPWFGGTLAVWSRLMLLVPISWRGRISRFGLHFTGACRSLAFLFYVRKTLDG
jgi:hypothetical protein